MEQRSEKPVVAEEAPIFDCAYCGERLDTSDQYGFEHVSLKWAVCWKCFKKAIDNMLKVKK